MSRLIVTVLQATCSEVPANIDWRICVHQNTAILVLTYLSQFDSNAKTSCLWGADTERSGHTKGTLYAMYALKEKQVYLCHGS